MRTRIVVLMFALSAMSYFDRTIMSISAPSIIREFGISETAMGTIFSAFLASYTLCMTPGGGLADRFGPRLVLAVSGLGAALFTGLTALCGRPGLGALLGVVPAFLVVRLGFGLATAPLYPACGRVVTNWIRPEGRARMQALILSGASVGSAISPFVFSRLIALIGWRRAFGWAAGATVALSLFWWRSARNEPPGGREGAPARAEPIPWGRLLADRNLLLLTLGYFCLNYFEYIFFYWIYYYFGEIRHMGRDQSAGYVTAMFLTMAAGLFGGGWVSDRLAARLGLLRGRRTVAVLGMTASAVLLYLGAASSGVAATATYLSLALGLASAAEGPFWATAMETGPGKAGTAGGILNTGGNLGGMLAPILTPVIAARLGWSWGLYAGSAMVLLGVAAWFLLDAAAATAAEREAARA